MAFNALFDALFYGNAQHNRLLKLETPLGDDWLVPLQAKGTSRLGRDYEFVVERGYQGINCRIFHKRHVPTLESFSRLRTGKSISASGFEQGFPLVFWCGTACQRPF